MLNARLSIERLGRGAAILVVTSYDSPVLSLPKFLLTALAWITLSLIAVVPRVPSITQVYQLPVQVSLPPARALCMRPHITIG
jgi:hypothetical protein